MTDNNKLLASYRLGIDLGTSSIGVVAYNLDAQKHISGVLHLDSYIFGEPVAPKEMVTLNSMRRAERLIRRQVERKAARLRKIGFIAASLGITREDVLADKEDVICLRAKAVTQEISLPQLIKVFCHIVKNRGYKGTLKGSDGSKVKNNIKVTEKLLEGGKTLGQLLYERKSASNGNPWRKVEDSGTFIYREMIEEEFRRIYEEQSKYHVELKGRYAVWGDNLFPDFSGQKEISLQEAFHSAIFYQRPIRWELETVGDCAVFPEEKRAACAQLAYQRYRLAKEIADLRFYIPGKKAPEALSPKDRRMLFDYIDGSSEAYIQNSSVMAFSKIYEKLNFLPDMRFTADRSNGAKRGIRGNSTSAAFQRAGVFKEWMGLSDKGQELVVEFLANITTFSDIEDNSASYIQQEFARLTKNVASSPEDLQEGLEFILTLRDKNVFSSFSLEKGRSSYGVKALGLLTERILKGEQEEAVLAQIHTQEHSLRGKLRSVEAIKAQESINDPVISRALAEFYRVMNYIVKKYGLPEEIVVELSRDMKKSLQQRKWLEGQNKQRAQLRQEAVAELQKGQVLVTPRNIEKYLLWKEQDEKCPYSGNHISFSQAFDENYTQIDHIIPQRGEIAGPDVFENKVLVFKQENLKKSNQLPYQWKFQEDIDAYLAFLKTEKENYKKAKKNKAPVEKATFGYDSSLINFVIHLQQLYKKEEKGYLSPKDHKWKPTQRGVRIARKIHNLLITPEELKEDFNNRQNQETAWIGKIVLGWCKDICSKVTPSFGGLTSYLRGHLHFNRVLPHVRLLEEKDLFDKDNHIIEPEKWTELFDTDRLEYSESKALKSDFEAYCRLLDTKPQTKTDFDEAFKNFRREQRTLLQFNKRCDYRHHAVDAAVIGLCDLSMIKRAADHHARYGTLEKIEYTDENGVRDKSKDIPGFLVDDIAQYHAIRQELEKRLAHYVVWHKPDHFPAGKLFDETAYNVKKKENMARFVHRAPLQSFLKANNKLRTKTELISHLESVIFGEEIKQAVLKQLQARLDAGMTAEEALCGQKDNPQDGIYYRGKKVQKLQYMYKERFLAQFAPGVDKEVIHTDLGGKKHHKFYRNYGYACIEFDFKTGRIVKLIPLWSYQPHESVPEGIIRVFIGDILYDTENKQFYKVRKFSSSSGAVCMLTTEVPKKNFKEKFKNISNFKKYKVVATRQDITKLKSQ